SSSGGQPNDTGDVRRRGSCAAGKSGPGIPVFERVGAGVRTDMRVISAAEESAAGGYNVAERTAIDADLQNQSVEVWLCIEQIPEAHTRYSARYRDIGRGHFGQARCGGLR